jgi:hypothetical protein
VPCNAMLSEDLGNAECASECLRVVEAMEMGKRTRLKNWKGYHHTADAVGRGIK